MHRRSSPRLSKIRLDAAVKAMDCYGFSRELVCRTITELLTAYGEEGWPFIEQNSYLILLETLLKQPVAVKAKYTHQKEGVSEGGIVKNAEDSSRSVRTRQFSHASSSKTHCYSEIDEDEIPLPQALEKWRKEMRNAANTTLAKTLANDFASTWKEHDNIAASKNNTLLASQEREISAHIIASPSKNIGGPPEEMQVLPLKKRKWSLSTVIEDPKILSAKEIFRDAIQLNLKELIEQEKTPELISSIGILLEAESIPDSSKLKLRRFLDSAQHLTEKYFSCKENSANMEANISQYKKHTSKLLEKEEYIDRIKKEVDVKTETAKELAVEYEKLKTRMDKVKERQMILEEEIKANQRKLNREEKDTNKMKNVVASATELVQTWRDSKIRADLQAQQVLSSWDVLRETATFL